MADLLQELDSGAERRDPMEQLVEVSVVEDVVHSVGP